MIKDGSGNGAIFFCAPGGHMFRLPPVAVIKNASPSRIKNVPLPPRKLQIILQGSPEHLERILYMGGDLTDRDAVVCGNLGISLAIETAGDEYVSGLLRHAPDTSPEKILHFGGKNPVRIDALQRSDFVHLHPVAEFMDFHLDGCPDAAGLEVVKASVDDDAESVCFPVVSICFVLFLP